MKTKATFSKVLAWTLMFAMVLGMTPAAVANIDEYENSLFSEIRFTNPLNGLSFKATGDFEVGASRQGAAMTPESELGFVITRDRADAYSVEYDDSMVSYITAYSETPMQTLSFVFSESLTDVAYQKDGSAFESLAKWDGSSPAPSLYYTEILSADSLTYSINFVGFYDADFPKGYDGITFQFTTDSGTFTVALTAQAAETFTVAFDLSELAVATNNTSGDGWSILYNNIIITESTLPVTLHGDSGGRSVRIENATDITLAEGTIISSNTSAEPALRINGAATIHGEGAGIEISSSVGHGIHASGNLEITGTIRSISGGMDGSMHNGIASDGDLTINGTIYSI
ncbi:MAG: hypothetical protein FWG93_03715, partial [Oscillospiraceae bacterium]|nr:hypothetical protein [Oscillospiraceae bacterium]